MCEETFVMDYVLIESNLSLQSEIILTKLNSTTDAFGNTNPCAISNFLKAISMWKKKTFPEIQAGVFNFI